MTHSAHPDAASTARRFQAQHVAFGGIESVLLIFWVSISNLCARHIRLSKTVLRDGFSGVWGNRLADFTNNISSLRQQQDGKTLSLSKKGYIHMRAHAHVHGPSKSKKSVFRLADASRRLVGSVGLIAGKSGNWKLGLSS